MMEPIFMGQLPELMKNYKDEETDILAGLEERLGEVDLHNGDQLSAKQCIDRKL